MIKMSDILKTRCFHAHLSFFFLQVMEKHHEFLQMTKKVKREKRANLKIWRREESKREG